MGEVDIKGNSSLDIILLSLLCVKIIWVLVIFSHFIVKKYYYQNKCEKIIVVFEDILHNVFTLLIGILLIYLYNHLTASKVCVEGHPKMYLYGFGLLSCIGIIQKAIHRYHFTGTFTEIGKYI
jgi:hypothetical protein